MGPFLSMRPVAPMKMEITVKYIAQIRDRKGRLLFETGPHDTRVQAAEFAFRCPRWRVPICSTSQAYQDPDGGWRSSRMDIRWHRRDEIPTKSEGSNQRSVK